MGLLYEVRGAPARVDVAALVFGSGLAGNATLKEQIREGMPEEQIRDSWNLLVAKVQSIT